MPCAVPCTPRATVAHPASASSRTWPAGRSWATRATRWRGSSQSRCSPGSHFIPALTNGTGSHTGSGGRRETFRIPHSAFRTMKFLCVECDRQMAFEERQLPGDGTLAAAFRCPQCGRVVAMLTNPMETQLVASLGVKIGGATVSPQPLETIRAAVATGKDDAFDEGKGHFPTWSDDAQERLARVPGFVRGMGKRIYSEYARDRGITLVTTAVLDAARPGLGLEGM